MVRRIVRIVAVGVLASVSMVPAVSVQASDTPAPSSVTIAGSLQSELGCPEDWDPTCEVTQLSYDATDGVWQYSFVVPAGDWEYKAALDGSWAENYGAGAMRDGANIPMMLAEAVEVKFYYDHETHWVTDNYNRFIATAPGSYQSEVGCPGDWQPDCLRSWLQDPDADGIHSFTTTAIPAGNYEFKVALNETWTDNYGAGGVPNGANIPFSVPVAGSRVTFALDTGSQPWAPTVTVESGPPVVTPLVSGTTGDNGWYTSDVHVSWTVTAGTPTIGCDPVTLTTDSPGVTYSCTATSSAGTTTEVVTIKRDATGPQITWESAVPADGASYDYGELPSSAVTCTATDATSGVNADGCEVTGYSTQVGTHAMTASATDNAGNTTTATRTYTVRSWTLQGFYAPVAMGGVWNTVKAGSTVPLKFEVFAGTAELTDPSVITGFTQRPITCDSSGPRDDAIETSSTGGTILRYDTRDGQFVQNWMTPRKPGACHQVIVTSEDGSTLTALFKLT